MSLTEALDELVEAHAFSGVVRCDRDGRTVYAKAFGLAERGFGVANTLDTRFGVASVAKGVTALTVASILEEGLLDLGTPARELLGDDLPEVDDAVTVEHLLAHRSGIGDYLDEDAGPEVSDYPMPVPVHRLDTSEDYLSVLAGHPQTFPPGERFSYCNSGFVVLALLAERVVGGVPFPDLVTERVCRPAGMTDTAFFRSDELPGGVARGYLAADGLRTNVLHLPVRGSGDGGLYSTVTDLHRLWEAVTSHDVVGPHWVEELLRPRSQVPEEGRRYGLGFWVHATDDVVSLEGLDAGVSARTVHRRGSGTTFTVVSNTSTGTWPIARYLADAVLG